MRALSVSALLTFVAAAAPAQIQWIEVEAAEATSEIYENSDDPLTGVRAYDVQLGEINAPQGLPTSGLEARMERTIERAGLDADPAAAVIQTVAPFLGDPPDLELEISVLPAGDGGVYGTVTLLVESSVKFVRGDDDATLDQDDEEELDADPDDIVVRAVIWRASSRVWFVADRATALVTLNDTVDQLTAEFLAAWRDANPRIQQARRRGWVRILPWVD